MDGNHDLALEANAAKSGLTSHIVGVGHPATTVLPLPAAPADTDYRAWGRIHPESVSPMLEIRHARELGMELQRDYLPLHLLVHVMISGNGREHCVSLVFTDCVVTLTGRQLLGFCDDLRSGKVDFVHMFDYSLWPDGPSRESPAILAVEIKNSPARPEPPISLPLPTLVASR